MMTMTMQTIFIQLNNKFSTTTHNVLPENLFMNIIKRMTELWLAPQTLAIYALRAVTHIKMHRTMCSVRVFILYAAIYIVIIDIVYSSRLLLLFFKFARLVVFYRYVEKMLTTHTHRFKAITVITNRYWTKKQRKI